MGPPDAILGISEAFKKDSSPNKINLGVGAYRDDTGKPFILQCVKTVSAKKKNFVFLSICHLLYFCIFSLFLWQCINLNCILITFSRKQKSILI